MADQETRPFPETAIDANRSRLIGASLDRVDGPAKVAGLAKYAYEYAGEANAAYGVIVGSTIAKGRITEIQTKAVEAMPGVVLVMTHRNAPKQPAFISNAVPLKQGENRFSRPRPALADARVRYFGEPVALVVAETFEQARDAAAAVVVRYAEAKHASNLRDNRAGAYKPARINAGLETDTSFGDFDGAFASAAVKVDETYRTPWQNHNPLEPWATLAIWKGGVLTLYTAAQTLIPARAAIAATTGLPPDKVRIVSKFIGGGFGGKLAVESDAVLAAFAARALNRPVKVTMTRQQGFAMTGHRPEAIQRVRLGASRDGRLVATGMDVIEHSATYQQFAEQTAAFARGLYACPNRRTTHRLVDLDIPAPEAMRAPGEAIGTLSYEVAMDELAEKLAMDPIELRIRNEPTEDPERKVPFGSRNLVACMREGATRFGWDARNPTPRARRDGEWLIGMGMSASIRPNYLMPSRARATLTGNGRLRIQASMTDIGTGSYTIFSQIAAETLGLPMAAIDMELGDSSLPATPGSGGSYGAASVGSAVLDACEQLKLKIVAAAGESLDNAAFRDGALFIGNRRRELGQVVRTAGGAPISAEGAVTPGAEQRAISSASYGANFCEVAVNAVTAEIRVRRMLGVFGVGRVLNAKTTRSQLIGGMIWALSSVTHEETVIDDRWGSPVNGDLAEYHVPVHADAVEIEAIMLPELEPAMNPLKIKGVGELGICGAGAAVANAIHNACGVRVRDYPITLDKILARM